VKIHQIFINFIYNVIEFFVSNTSWINVTMNAIKTLLIGTALSIATTAVYADMKPEDAIKYRKAGYNVMSWNMSKIKAMAIDAPESFDAKQVANAATAIAAMANMGMGALYIAGSEESIGDMKTRAKAEIFTDKDGVKEVAVKFNQAANELAKVAATGDKVAIAQAFKDTGASCKACHDKYRKE
jgi:cytochrome c556